MSKNFSFTRERVITLRYKHCNHAIGGLIVANTHVAKEMCIYLDALIAQIFLNNAKLTQEDWQERL